jgi:hypothetical protein
MKGWKFRAPDGNPIGLTYPGDTASLPITWPNPRNAQAEDVIIARRTVNYRGTQWLFPTLGTSGRPAHPFLIWWAVLYALSMLARYEPKVWVNRISVNDSEDAAAIEYLLNEALNVGPELIHRTIMEVAEPLPAPLTNPSWPTG